MVDLVIRFSVSSPCSSVLPSSISNGLLAAEGTAEHDQDASAPSSQQPLQSSERVSFLRLLLKFALTTRYTGTPPSRRFMQRPLQSPKAPRSTKSLSLDDRFTRLIAFASFSVLACLRFWPAAIHSSFLLLSAHRSASGLLIFFDRNSSSWRIPPPSVRA